MANNESQATVHELPTAKTESFKLPSIGFTVKPVRNPYAFQLYVDFGNTNLGPFVKVGLNSVEYNMGYLPEEDKNGSEKQ